MAPTGCESLHPLPVPSQPSLLILSEHSSHNMVIIHPRVSLPTRPWLLWGRDHVLFIITASGYDMVQFLAHSRHLVNMKKQVSKEERAKAEGGGVDPPKEIEKGCSSLLPISRVLWRPRSEARPPGAELCLVPAVGTWACHLTSLCFNFLICNVRMKRLVRMDKSVHVSHSQARQDFRQSE